MGAQQTLQLAALAVALSAGASFAQSHAEIDRQRYFAQERVRGRYVEPGPRVFPQPPQLQPPFAGVPNTTLPIPQVIPPPKTRAQTQPIFATPTSAFRSGGRVIVAKTALPVDQEQDGQHVTSDEPSFGQKVADGLRTLWHWIVIGFLAIVGATGAIGLLYLWINRPKTKVDILKDAFADIDKVDAAYEAEIESIIERAGGRANLSEEDALIVRKYEELRRRAREKAMQDLA